MTGPTQCLAWGLSPSVPIHWQNIAISAMSLCASIPLRCWPFTAFLVEESGYRCFHNSHILRLRCPAALEQTGIHPILIPVHPTVGSLNAVLCLGNHS